MAILPIPTPRVNTPPLSLPPFPTAGTRAARAAWWHQAAAVLRQAAAADPEGGLYEIRYAGDHTINADLPAEGRPR
jgi:hypothetical protein